MFNTGALSVVKRCLPERLIVLGYHRLPPADPGWTPAPFSDEYGPTEAEFVAQLQWLKDNVHLVSEAEAIDRVHRGKGPGMMSVLLTFDDGYIDNYTRAYPILKRMGVPAVFFVAADQIERRTLGWADNIAWAINRSKKASFTYEGATHDLTGDRYDVILQFHRKMKKEMHLGKTLVEDLFEVCDVEPPSREVQDAQLMTWAHLAEVQQHDIAIGSHSHTHPILGTLTPDEQREELAKSKALIEHRLGRRVRTIAYPVGGQTHFNEHTERIAEECGYELGFSFYSGFNTWKTVRPYDVRRTALQDMDEICLAGATILPELLTWQMGQYAIAD